MVHSTNHPNLLNNLIIFFSSFNYFSFLKLFACPRYILTQLCYKLESQFHKINFLVAYIHACRGISISSAFYFPNVLTFRAILRCSQKSRVPVNLDYGFATDSKSKPYENQRSDITA